jgi:hypothetical protein
MGGDKHVQKQGYIEWRFSLEGRSFPTGTIELTLSDFLISYLH